MESHYRDPFRRLRKSLGRLCVGRCLFPGRVSTLRVPGGFVGGLVPQSVVPIGAVTEQVVTSDLSLSRAILQGGSWAFTKDEAPELIKNDAQLFSFLPDAKRYPFIHKLRNSGGGAFLLEGLEDAGGDCVLYFCNPGREGTTVYRNSRLVLQGPLSRIGLGGKAMEDALGKTPGRRCVSVFAQGVPLHHLAGDNPNEDVSKKYEPLLNHMAHVDALKKDADKWRVIMTLYADPDPVVSVNTKWQQKLIDDQKDEGKFLFFYRPGGGGRPWAKEYRVPCPAFSITFLHSSLRDGSNKFKHGVTVGAPKGREQYIVASCISNVTLEGSADQRFAAAQKVAHEIYAKMETVCCEILARDGVELGKDGKMVEIPVFDALSFAGRGLYFGNRASGRDDDDEKEDTDEWTQAMKDLEAWKNENGYKKCQYVDPETGEKCKRCVKTDVRRGRGRGKYCGDHCTSESRGLPKLVLGIAAGAPPCRFEGCKRAVQKVWDYFSDRHVRDPQGWCGVHSSAKGRGEKLSAADQKSFDAFKQDPDSFGALLRCPFLDPLKEHERFDYFTGEWGPARCVRLRPWRKARGKYNACCARHMLKEECVPGSCPDIGEKAPKWAKNKRKDACGVPYGRKLQDLLHPRGASATAAAAVPSAGADDAGGASANAVAAGDSAKRQRTLFAFYPKRQQIGYSKEAKGKGPAE